MALSAALRTHHVSYSVNIIVPSFFRRWLFATDEYDIGFGVSIFPLGTEDNGKSSGDEVVKSERVTSHLTPIDGRITCYVPGKCKI